MEESLNLEFGDALPSARGAVYRTLQLLGRGGNAEAYLVLQGLQKNHDANFGVNWDTIAYQAALLFGEPAEVEP